MKLLGTYVEAIIEKLSGFFVEREGEEILENLTIVDFIDEGLLDSLDFLSLAIFVEKEFDVKLDLTSEDTFKAMRTFHGLTTIIKESMKNNE